MYLDKQCKMCTVRNATDGSMLCAECRGKCKIYNDKHEGN